MNLLKSLSLLGIGALIFLQVFFTWNIFTPIDVQDNQLNRKIIECLSHVGIIGSHAKSVAEGIKIASNQHSLSPEFIIALIYTESTFNKYAKSSKDYKGYMQIPYSLYEPTENIMIGSRLMREKLTIAKGDILKAICLYKGWGLNPPPEGIKQAKKVLVLYHKLTNV